MKTILDILEERTSLVMAQISGCGNCPAMVKTAVNPRFGDYQVNGVMPLAGKLKKNAKKLAEEIASALELSDMCEKPQVAPPGFINLRLKTSFLADKLLEIKNDTADHLGIERVTKPQTVVVDFSSPNIAKQMHVGHLRSTIIGDCIGRMLEFWGHRVIRQNHVGDWGVQMGMLLFAVQQLSAEHLQASVTWDLETLERHYREVARLEHEDAAVAAQVRQWTVKLQEGDAFAVGFWRKACETTLEECYRLYDRLNVKLRHKDTYGESKYNDQLPSVVRDLLKAGCAKESEGAICVFPKGFVNKEGQPLPFIIQKSDSAYLYATTDLAALRYRLDELGVNRIIYVTDARQQLHFQMLFAVARAAGWAGENVQLAHVYFGSVLGEDGTPLKTRSGENVKLKELLDEAVERARTIVEQKNPELSGEEKAEIAEAVGIGAVKYADYCNNRTSDYVFSFDKMLAMEGNTAPYMQYAYARIKSIERKAEARELNVASELAALKALNLTEEAELDLAKMLIRYGEAIEAAMSDYKPNYLTSYLYELAQKFSVFYTNCPVLQAEKEKLPTRLLLCHLTAETIRHGLTELLGIKVVEQM